MTDPALAERVKGVGRMYRHPVSGLLVPSVTSIIGVLDKPALVGWAAKETAGAAWDNRNALMQMADRESAIDMLKNARYRSNERSKKLGTSVHEIAQALAQDSEIPTFASDEAPYADSFMRFVFDFDPKFTVVEGTVFGDGYAGTFDFLATIGDHLVLGDYKTSKSGIYPEVALQLSALRAAEELWDPVSGALSPMPAVAGTIAVWLRPDKYAVYAVDAGAAAYRAFRGALGAWPWVIGGENEGIVGPSMSPERLAAALVGDAVTVGKRRAS